MSEIARNIFRSYDIRGIYPTDLNENAAMLIGKGFASMMKRAGETYEIAPVFVYLASDDASYVTGQVMHINGGLYKG